MRWCGLQRAIEFHNEHQSAKVYHHHNVRMYHHKWLASNFNFVKPFAKRTRNEWRAHTHTHTLSALQLKIEQKNNQNNRIHPGFNIKGEEISKWNSISNRSF